MEMLKDKIRKFLTISGSYDGGDSCGYGSDETCGYGGGYSYGEGYRSGRGHGAVYNENYKFESAANGYGCGNSYGCGLKSINGHAVHIIDDTLTIITSVHNNIANGFVVRTDLQLIPCYIVRDGDMFAHGSTLHVAFNSLQEKLYDDSTEEERIEAFKKKFPEYDVKYSNKDLFIYHHVLTGSCKMGREAFVADRGLSLDGKTSVREFIELTKDSYGGEIIKKLPIVYSIK